jgi:hypothetical protein
MFRRVDRNEPPIGDDCTFGHDGRCGAIEDIEQCQKRRLAVVIQIKLLQSSIPRQHPPPPMRVLPQRVERSLDMTIERPHHAYPGEHRRAAALGNQQQRFHRGLPFGGIVFGLWELGDVGGGVAEGDELLAGGQFDGIEELLVPRQELTFT